MTRFAKTALSWALSATLVSAGALGLGVATTAAQAKHGGDQAYASTLPSASGTWRVTAGKWWYAYNAGGYASNGWQKISGAWYHFDRAGWMQTGWLNDQGRWYHLSPWGTMQTGWIYAGGAWYYLNSAGVMQTGWQKVGANWYYLNSAGVMQTGWQKISNKWYYLGRSGAMATGWQKISGKWYLLGSDGAMKTGWQKVGDLWYYLQPSGVMAVNAWIGNSWVGSTGAMATNSWVDGGKYYVDAHGVWDPNAVRNENNSSGTLVPPDSSEGAPTAYNYEAQVLNPSRLYSDQPIIVFLRTNNPNPRTIELVSDDGTAVQMLICEPYDDVHLADPKAGPASLQKLASGAGYIATISVSDSGTHGIRVAEYEYRDNATVATKRTYSDVLTQVTVNDYDAALSAWMDDMLATYTNDSMTPPQKMIALCEAFDGGYGGLFIFDPILYPEDADDSSDVVAPDESEGKGDRVKWRFARLISHSMPFFDSYTWDSLTAPTVLCLFAERIGGFTDIHNCYYDYEEESSKWDETHYYCTAYYEGLKYNFEAVPHPDTNVVTDIHYINL